MRILAGNPRGLGGLMLACLLAACAVPGEHGHVLRADPPPQLDGGMLELATPDGGAVAAYATGDPAARRGLLLLHEMWGLTDWVKSEADRWARAGYRVLALDLYAGRVARDSRTAYGYMRGADPRRVARATEAALAALQQGGRDVGVLGFCFGGEQALVAALAHPARVGAVVVYYGRPETAPRRLARLTAPVLGLFATEDSWVPRADVERFARAMRVAGKTLELEWFEAGHAFANPSGAHYDAALAARARIRAAAFFDARLAPRLPDESGTR